MSSATSLDSVCHSLAKSDRVSEEKKKRYLICNPIDTSKLWKEDLEIVDLHVDEESLPFQ